MNGRLAEAKIVNIPSATGEMAAWTVHVINPRRILANKRGMTIEAHPDDLALGGGIFEELIDRGVGMTNVSLTGGGASRHDYVQDRELIERRRVESRNALSVSRFAMGVHVGLTDRRLTEEKAQGVTAVRTIIAATKPQFIGVTNIFDEHPDHAAAAEIALDAADGEIPVYMMDTVNMRDRNDKPLKVTHVFEISDEAFERRNDAYLEHVTQTHGLMGVDKVNFDAVFHLPKLRGSQHFVTQVFPQGLPQAAILYNATPDLPDVIGETLSDILIYQADRKDAVYAGRI